jgi:LysR family transcriptional regulator of gallate degradation
MLVASLRAGDIDFILGALRPTHAASGLLGQALTSEEMVVLARRDHPLAGAPHLSLAQLANARWILPRRHAPARRILDALFVRQGLEPPTASVETGDLELIRGVLLRTDMVAAVSRQQLHSELELGRLAALPVPMMHTRRDIGLTTRATGELSPAAQKLADAVRSVVIDMEQDGVAR